MALDKILIGARIRKVREEIFEQSREQFAIKCELTERHVGQLERGDFLLSMDTLDKILTATGVDANYILYGTSENNRLQVSDNLHNIINRSDKEELQLYYKIICSIRSHVSKKTKK